MNDEQPEPGVVYIIDGGPVSADAVRELVSTVSEKAAIEVMGTDANWLIQRRAEEGRGPDLIVVSAPDPDAFWVQELLSAAMANFPDLPLLVVGSEPADQVARAYQDAGAWLYVESDRLEQVQEEIRWALGEGTDLEPPERAARHTAERMRLMMREAQRVMRLVTHISDRVFIRDRDGRFLYASEPTAMDFGLAREEVPGKDDTDIWGEQRGRQFLRTDLEVMAAGECVRNWQEETLELMEKIPVLDGDGEACGLVVVTSHPGLRSDAWWELVQGGNMARTFPDAFIGIDAHDNINGWNPGARDIYGYEDEEALGMDLMELAASESRDDFECALARVREHGSVERLRMVHRRSDAARIHVEAVLWPFVEPTGTWRLCHMVARDISAQVAREQEMKQALEHVSRAARQLGEFADVSAEPAQPHGYHDSDIEQIAREVRADPCADHDFREAARRCHVSYGYFRRLFREHTGRPPYDYMLLWRMRRAARALRDLDKPIKAVAREIGYSEPRQFSRMFKKQMGMTPTQYRESQPPEV